VSINFPTHSVRQNSLKFTNTHVIIQTIQGTTWDLTIPKT